MGSRTSTAAPEKKETLFELTEDLRALEQLLTEGEGEITPELQAWMAEYSGKLEGKVDAIGWFIRQCEAREAGHVATAQTIEAEGRTFRAKARTEQNKRARILEYIRACLVALGTTKLEGKAYQVAIEKTGGKRSIELLEPFKSNPELLPDQFKHVSVTANLEAVRAALEANPADESIGRFLPQGDHVRLR